MLHRTILCSLGTVLALTAFAGCGSRHEGVSSSTQPIEGSSCPTQWLDAAPPNPSWPTLSSIMPIQYNDTGFVFSMFPAPLEDLQTLLPPGLSPLPIAQGVGMFGAFFLNFEDIDGLQPYREAHVAVVVADSSLNEGFTTPEYSKALVVTTKESQWVGVQGFGMNKILGNTVCYRVPPQGVRCMAAADGKLILKMELKTTDLGPIPPSALATLGISVKDGQIVRAPFLYEGVRPDAKLVGTLAPGAATLEFGDHPLGQQLAALRIGRSSVNSAWGVHMHTTLYEGFCSPAPAP